MKHLRQVFAPFVIPAYDYMDVGGTSPGMGVGRPMQEQLSRATQDAKAEAGIHSKVWLRSQWMPDQVRHDDALISLIYLDRREV